MLIDHALIISCTFRYACRHTDLHLRVKSVVPVILRIEIQSDSPAVDRPVDLLLMLQDLQPADLPPQDPLQQFLRERRLIRKDLTEQIIVRKIQFVISLKCCLPDLRPGTRNALFLSRNRLRSKYLPCLTPCTAINSLPCHRTSFHTKKEACCEQQASDSDTENGAPARMSLCSFQKLRNPADSPASTVLSAFSILFPMYDGKKKKGTVSVLPLPEHSRSRPFSYIITA